MKILIVNGPNMNMLGIREPDIYGRGTYTELCDLMWEHGKKRGIELRFFQSNHEGAIIDAIQGAYYDGTDGIVINPAGYTHTSVAIADAIKAVGIPTVEVHISDLSAREAYRQISCVRDCCVKTVSGHGFAGYLEAIDTIAELKNEG